MSGSLAARYIAGLPYDPSLGVGQYARAPRAAAPTGQTTTPPGTTVTIPQIDGTGQPVRVPDATPTTVGNTGGTGAIGKADGGVLLAAALGLLPFLPDVYNYISDLLGDGSTPPPVDLTDDVLPTPPEQLPPPEIPGTTPYGTSDLYGQLWGSPVPGQDGLHHLYDGQGRDLGSLDLMEGADDFGDLGAIDPDLAAEGGVPPADGGAEGVGAGWFNNPLGLPAEFMTGDLGLGTAAGVNLDTLALNVPAAVFGYGVQGLAKPGGELGAGIGSTLGGILGSVLGGPWGAAAGTIAGGAIGGQIGPAPTVGRNFSATGTIGGDGRLHWGNAGGDNGGNGADASAFADWFSGNLAQQAAAHGYGINPNMAGAQIRIGGYDNFNRIGVTPGGYFYDITNQGGQFGGSPERYALRPSDDWNTGAYSAGQADAFTTNVLADLVSRGVYTPGGAAGQDNGYLGSTLGANYGWYGSPGGDYSRIEYGGGDFGSILGGRQNAITGYLNDQQRQAMEAQARANTVPIYNDQGASVGAYDLSQPIWWQGGLVNPSDFGLTQAMAQGSAPVDLVMAGVQGTQGVQWGENGPIGPGDGSVQVPADWYQDGGA